MALFITHSTPRVTTEQAATPLHRFLRDYFNTTNAMPSVRQIMRYTGYRSTSSVYKELRMLERMGKIRKLRRGAVELTNSYERS